MSTNPSLIETLHLTVQRGSKRLLDGISVSLPPGLTYLIGKNGSGKTTFLRCLAHLISYEGLVRFQGKDLAQLSAAQLAQDIAVIHQRLQMPQYISLRDFVLMGRFPHRRWWESYGAADHEKVEAALSRLGITDLAERRLDEVSGGEWQKGLVARALVQEASLWLFDEPAAFLDPLAKDHLYALLADFAAEGQHILCVTHDAFALQDHPCHVWAMRAGTMLMQTDAFAGTPAEIQAIFG